VARAHADRVGQAGGRQVLGEVAEDVVDGAADDVVVGSGWGHVHAHLGLVARSLQVGDQIAGDLAGQLGAVVLLDERERQVQAAGDAGGGGHPALADEDRGGVDPHVAVAPGQTGREPPVRGRAVAVEQAGRGEHGGAGADRCDPAALPGQPAYVRDDQRVVGGGLVAEAARDDEGVQWAGEPLQRELRLHHQAAVAPDRVAARGGQFDPVARS